eukprot:GHVU01064301.1.p2 GENE.GHVU01064301.1~~GHVU01064301.1.p2  ORF type:complete len:227 (-),score=8.82 GHVU01064301.1:760-1440(-)
MSIPKCRQIVGTGNYGHCRAMLERFVFRKEMPGNREARHTGSAVLQDIGRALKLVTARNLDTVCISGLNALARTFSAYGLIKCTGNPCQIPFTDLERAARTYCDSFTVDPQTQRLRLPNGGVGLENLSTFADVDEGMVGALGYHVKSHDQALCGFATYFVEVIKTIFPHKTELIIDTPVFDDVAAQLISRPHWLMSGAVLRALRDPRFSTIAFELGAAHAKQDAYR